MDQEKFIVKVDCKDASGLLKSITEIIFKHNFNITSLQEHVEEETYFFSRIIIESLDHTNPTRESCKKDFINALSDVLPTQANISINKIQKRNIIIMVSKEYHCFAEIIFRCKYDNLPANILAVIGNHDNAMQELCNFAGVPFHYIASPKDIARAEHEAQILKVLAQYATVDYIVMARYMRILSEKFISHYPQKIINIHHSFLPAFIGANPYRQARNRGVKIIGATAHYATADLDEGPIIAQQVKEIDHSATVKDLQSIGRDIEKITLANALNLIFADRVFIFKNKTIIL